MSVPPPPPPPGNGPYPPPGGWPYPPPGGWPYPPPPTGTPYPVPPPWSQYPPPRRPLLSRRVLDEQMAASRAQDRQPWGPAPWLGPVLTLLIVIVVGEILVHTLVSALEHRPYVERAAVGIAFAVGPELLLLLACVGFARPIVARYGSWREAFGLDVVRAGDWAPFGIGVAMVFLGRIVTNELSLALTRGRGAEQAQNLTLNHRPSVLQIVVLGLVVVVIAPIAEELMFRGLLLRTFMRRWGFWPAAAASTALFALFHVYEVSTVIGAVFLAASIAVLGGVNCYLVRITGRLTPGMLVHASFNALAVVVVVAQAGH